MHNNNTTILLRNINCFVSYIVNKYNRRTETDINTDSLHTVTKLVWVDILKTQLNKPGENRIFN